MSTSVCNDNGVGVSFSRIERRCNYNDLSVIRLSRTEKNPERIFYSCSKLKVSSGCLILCFCKIEVVVALKV